MCFFLSVRKTSGVLFTLERANMDVSMTRSVLCLLQRSQVVPSKMDCNSKERFVMRDMSCVIRAS